MSATNDTQEAYFGLTEICKLLDAQESREALAAAPTREEEQ